MNDLAEARFAAQIEEISRHPRRGEQLFDFLLEDHPVYAERGAAATVRMRGWILLALARAGLSDRALVFILEELQTGKDPYIVAAAARALRSCSRPLPEFARFLMTAFTNLRYRDDPVTLERYGGYEAETSTSSPLREVLTTLAWIGPAANCILPELELLGAERRLAPNLLPFLEKAVTAIRAGGEEGGSGGQECCQLPRGVHAIVSWARSLRRNSSAVENVVFQDQDGANISYSELLRGHPSIVVFFYTRCDNPLKCSLTITKLARVQKILEDKGLSEKIWTVAITYDPGFDLPNRLRSYGKARGLEIHQRSRLVRTIQGLPALRNHFKLGVNFIGSLVNRHRVEAYVLDEEGRAAFGFERIHWDESKIVDCAVEVWNEDQKKAHADAQPDEIQRDMTPPVRSNSGSSSFWGALSSLGLALFPKCPACWASYLSVSGIAALQSIPYSPWLLLVFVALMLINLGTVWIRRHSIAGRIGVVLVAAGTLMTVVSRFMWTWDSGALLGFFLTFFGSVASAVQARRTAKVLSKTA